jgi:hypothetical protein
MNFRHRRTVDQPLPRHLPSPAGLAVRTATKDLPSTPLDRSGPAEACATKPKRTRPQPASVARTASGE